MDQNDIVLQMKSKEVSHTIMKISAICFIALICTLPVYVLSQGPIAIDLSTCHQLAKENFPLIKQAALLDQAEKYNLENASNGYYPQILVSGQATYQSDVTGFPIHLPNINIPELAKDQYRLYAELNQSLTDAFVIPDYKDLILLNTKVEEEKLEVELYKLKERINQIYFGILLFDEQIQLNETLQKDLQLGLDRVKAAIENGTSVQSNAQLLEAEVLKTRQKKIELASARIAFIEMLEAFTKIDLDEDTQLIRPNSIEPSSNNLRPELRLIEAQQKSLEIQDKIITARTLPKLNLFLQGGLGRPALNMLSGDFDLYYIGGLKLNWNISSLYNTGNERKIIDIGRKTLESQRETFLFNSEITSKQQFNEIHKYDELVILDEEIIQLRESIAEKYKVQLENGIITPTEYLAQVNAADIARQNKSLHILQQLLTQYNQLNTLGQ